MENITSEWIKEKLEKYNLTNRYVAKNIGVTEFEMSKFKHGKTPIGSQSQAALYWFFRCLELEKELKK